MFLVYAMKCEHTRTNAILYDFVRFCAILRKTGFRPWGVAHNRTESDGKMCVVGPQAALVVTQHLIDSL